MNRAIRIKSVRVSAAVGLFAAASLYVSAALLFSPSASAQSPQSHQVNTKIALKKFVDAANKLSPEVTKHLSPAMQNYLRYANAAVNAATVPSGNLAAPQSFPVPANQSPQAQASAADPNLIQVSSLALDSQKQGYTQNTTSSAWCGNSVVVGYEDTGAFFRTDPTLSSGVPISQDGVSFSTNAGKTFTDLGFLNPGTFSANALLGDPVVTCTSPTHFQYVSILNTTTPDGFNPIIGPSISFSTDAGKTWSAPQQIISLDGNTELVDKPWLAVDPYNLRHMYLTYTHVSFLGCTNVELVRSTDSGKTWSAPVAINSDCANPQIVMDTASNVVVSPGGKVYVAYESFPAPPAGASFGKNAIYLARSLNAGATFAAPVKISEVVPGGDGVYLNGPIHADDYPQLAVDRSSGPSHGAIYVTWPDGRDHIVPDRNAPSGTYAYPDIFVAKSTNFGASFKVLGAVSPTPKTFRGIGRDQFLPTVAVDNDAEVAVCYYDRRNDPANLRVTHFCSISTNQGKTWTDLALSTLDWVPTPNLDPLNSGGRADISDYDALTTEFFLHSDGFFASFITEQNAKQSVVAKKF
jgi:hypothetical protein